MNFKNILIIEKKLEKIIEKIKIHIEYETKRLSDMEYLIHVIKYYVDDIEIMKQSITKGDGEVTEQNFKIFIEEINEFSNEAIKLL